MTQRLSPSNFPDEVSALVKDADELRGIVDRFGLPGFWQRPQRFESLVKIILEQQVSLAAATTLYRRIHAELGGMSARRLMAAGPARLHTLGMTRQKARYCHTLAEAITKRQLSLGGLQDLEDEQVIARLCEFPGIGPWTANAYVMIAMGRVDAWPPGDLALIRAIEELLPDEDTAAIARTADRWRPRRAVAARLIWHYYLSTR